MNKQSKKEMTQEERLEVIKLLISTYEESRNNYRALLRAVSWGVFGVVLGLVSRFILLMEYAILGNRTYNDWLIITTTTLLSVASLFALSAALWYAWKVRENIDKEK